MRGILTETNRIDITNLVMLYGLLTDSPAVVHIRANIKRTDARRTRTPSIRRLGSLLGGDTSIVRRTGLPWLILTFPGTLADPILLTC
jgi:hypothetical protein